MEALGRKNASARLWAVFDLRSYRYGVYDGNCRALQLLCFDNADRICLDNLHCVYIAFDGSDPGCNDKTVARYGQGNIPFVY